MAILAQDTPAPRTAGISRYRRPDRDFVIVANSFARGKHSARAVKVGLYVLSHVDDYVLTQARIASEIDLSLRTVQAALDDLESYGLLIRHDVRDERGHRIGTRMHVKDEPFTAAERADLGESLNAESAHAESAPADSAPPKKTNSTKKIKKQEDPSGGAAAAAPEAEHVEDAVKTRTKQPEPAGLFEVEKPPAPEPHGAAAVVASYVLAYRQAHGETDPVKSHKGRVARDAKQILEAGQATEAELVQVAARLGRGDFANLGTELAMSRRTSGKPGRPGMAHAAPNDDPRWEAYAGPVLTGWTEDEERDFQDYLARNGG